ncbi:MAG: PUR family DNA/RNA-binding protein [Paludibacteraceae bacterium]|nr:PUR family DNA/RNA-binding protein [Paludibacteraceae bacterium]
MEGRKFETSGEPEIVYSRSVKAGKRIYYLDVKKARNDDLYLCLTESKRRQGAEEEPPQFEKHKLFLYKEDFSHFLEGLNDVVNYVRSQVGEIEDREEWTPRDADNQSDAEAEEENEEQPKRGLFGFMNR